VSRGALGMIVAYAFIGMACIGLATLRLAEWVVGDLTRPPYFVVVANLALGAACLVLVVKIAKIEAEIIDLRTPQ
jgi:hypothetical protein